MRQDRDPDAAGAEVERGEQQTEDRFVRKSPRRYVVELFRHAISGVLSLLVVAV